MGTGVVGRYDHGFCGFSAQALRAIRRLWERKPVSRSGEGALGKVGDTEEGGAELPPSSPLGFSLLPDAMTARGYNVNLVVRIPNIEL